MPTCTCDTFNSPVTCNNSTSTPALTCNNSAGLGLKVVASGYTDGAYIRANGGGCAVWGENYGSGTGVAGSTAGYLKAGVWGSHVSEDEPGYGVYGTVTYGGSMAKAIYGTASTSEGATGVEGHVYCTSMYYSPTYGGHFKAYGGGSQQGVYGINVISTRLSGSSSTVGANISASGYNAVGTYSFGTVVGVHADSSNSGSIALKATGTSGAKGAVITGNSEITGNLAVYGTLSKTAGSFVIDHPLDPENKMLTHSFVESPEMKNVYDGTVIVDSNGDAVVSLPSYFDALNCDVRYQLTSLGGAAPDLHVSQEVKDNKFKISGAKPNSKVCWLVTGNRQDSYAKANPVVVEKDKEHKGFYFAPEAHGKDSSKHIMFKMNENSFNATNEVREKSAKIVEESKKEIDKK